MFEKHIERLMPSIQNLMLGLPDFFKGDLARTFALAFIALVALLIGLNTGYFIVLWIEWGAILGGLALTGSVFLFPTTGYRLQELRVILFVAGLSLAGAGVTDLLNFPKSNSDVLSGSLIGLVCGLLIVRAIWTGSHSLVYARISALFSRNGVLIAVLLSMLGIALFVIADWLQVYGLSAKTGETLASVGAVAVQLFHLQRNGPHMQRGAVWITLTFMLIFLLGALANLAPLAEMSEEFSIGLVLVAFAGISLLVKKWVRNQNPVPATTTHLIISMRQMVVPVLLGSVLLPLMYFYMQAFISLGFNLSPTELVANDEVLFKLSDEAFAKLMMRDVYYWEPKPNMSMAKEDTPAIYIKKLARDRWSHATTETNFDDWEAGIQNGRGIILMKQLGHYIASYVSRDSPAAKAGYQRGDQFVMQDMSGDNEQHWLLLKPSGETVPVTTLADRYKLDAAIHKIVKQDGKNIGYLWLLNFSGAIQPVIQDAFKEFRKQGVEELVLDLRYNGGGHADAFLASMIAGARFSGRVYTVSVYSDKYRDRNGVELLNSLPESIPIKRVFVLTTSRTCSASELIINGLRPYVSVITIGGTTCGKPYFMSPVTYGGYVYMPVTGRLMNSDGKADYERGIAPDCSVVEDYNHPIGGIGDVMLDAALYYQQHNSCPSKS